MLKIKAEQIDSLATEVDERLIRLLAAHFVHLFGEAHTDRAIGPLRVDWSCEEIGPDLTPINTGMTDDVKDFVRSRFYVGDALQQQAANHTPPDIGRALPYTNCPEAMGGSRPASLASHSEKLFGAGDLSLAPWTAAPDAATQTTRL